MLRYRVKTFVDKHGRSVAQVVEERIRHGLDTTVADLSPISEREIELEPKVFIRVYDCQASLAAEIECGKGSSVIVCYDGKLPKQVEDAIFRDVAKQGSITWSGHYEILSRCIQRFIESQRFQRWLKKEIETLGLEIKEGGENNEVSGTD